jgi:hypothetical protein
VRTIFLCGHPLDWPRSRSQNYEDQRAGSLTVDLGTLPDDPRAT